MAWTRRPHSGSRRPMITTSTMPGCSLNAASTSAGYTLAAPVTIRSTRAVGHVEVAVLVQPAQIADRVEAVVGLLHRRDVVADVGGQWPGRRAEEDAADLAGCEHGAVGPDDAHLGIVHPTAEGARMGQPLVATAHHEADLLGGPVGHVEVLGPDQVDPLVAEPPGEGGRPLLDPAQAGQVPVARCPRIWAIRWSMGVAAMNPVIRWRSTMSRASSALKRCIRTIGSPCRRTRKAVNPLVW